MSGYPSHERSERARRILLISTALLVVLSSVLTVALMALPIAVFRGFLLDGYISLLGYDLSVAHARAEVPPLESVAMISRVVLLIVAVALLSLALALVEGGDGAPGMAPLVSLMASLAQVSLTYSLLRVVIRDVMPALPTNGYAAHSSAGFVTIYPPETRYGLPYDLFTKQSHLLIALLVALLIALVLYAGRLYLQLSRAGGGVGRGG
ncbi:MAG: hypothetical protein ABWK00_07080 [Desulfurococcaceae archaeon]